MEHDAGPTRIARSALAAYELPTPIELRPIRLINNSVFEVVGADGTRAALRVHRPGYRTEKQIRSELTFLQALAAKLDGTPVDVPQPIATHDGELVVRVDAGDAAHDCTLLTWVDGRVLKHGCGLGPRSTFLLGEGLARLHRAAERFDAPGDFELPTWDADAMFSQASPFNPGPLSELLTPGAWALFREVAARTREVFAELDRLDGQRGLIHNDYVLINCHFRRAAGGWRLGILDFDDLGWGYFLYDVAPLLGNLFDYPDAFSRLRRSFLEGYRSVRPLAPALEAHLRTLMAARHAATVTWLAAKWRRGDDDVPVRRHVQIRVSEMERCLTPTRR